MRDLRIEVSDSVDAKREPLGRRSLVENEPRLTVAPETGRIFAQAEITTVRELCSYISTFEDLFAVSLGLSLDQLRAEVTRIKAVLAADLPDIVRATTSPVVRHGAIHPKASRKRRFDAEG